MTRERMLRRRRRRKLMKEIGRINLMLWCVIPGLNVILSKIEFWSKFWSFKPKWLSYVLLLLQFLLLICSLIYLFDEWLEKRRNKEPWE